MITKDLWMSPPFMVKAVWNGSVLTDIKVAPEVHNVYVYKWNDVPLLVEFELFSKEVLSFANLGSKWEPIFTPQHDNYRRMPYLRDLLSHLNCIMGNGAVVDLYKRNSSKRLVYREGACNFLDLPNADTAPVTVELVPRNNRGLNGYKEFRHIVKGKYVFDVRFILHNTRRVMIDLPSGPIRSISCFVKNKNVVSYVEVVAGEYIYYKNMGNNTFVKYAVSNQPLGDTKDITHYTAGKIYIWNRGRLTNK